MDYFYAQVEERDDPSLVGKPMAVGGTAMMLTSNYVARKYGVRPAMPGFVGKRLCPELILVPAHYEKYQEASNHARSVFEQYDANYISYSLDEALLDITAVVDERLLDLYGIVCQHDGDDTTTTTITTTTTTAATTISTSATVTDQTNILELRTAISRDIAREIQAR
jgi:DNA polymerase kappa